MVLKYPTTTIFPLESVVTELPKSLFVPPILLAQSGVPAESYFTTKASSAPVLANVNVTVVPFAA